MWLLLIICYKELNRLHLGDSGNVAYFDPPCIYSQYTNTRHVSCSALITSPPDVLQRHNIWSELATISSHEKRWLHCSGILPGNILLCFPDNIKFNQNMLSSTKSCDSQLCDTIVPQIIVIDYTPQELTGHAPANYRSALRSYPGRYGGSVESYSLQSGDTFPERESLDGK